MVLTLMTPEADNKTLADKREHTGPQTWPLQPDNSISQQLTS